MRVREFSAPTRVVCASGCVTAHLAEELCRLDAPVVAVVADRGVAEAGLLDAVLPALPHIRLIRCPLIGENPSVQAAEAAARHAVGEGARAVLAIGGGSGLGAAKAVAIRLTNDGQLQEWEGRDRVPKVPAPSIAIPTTAGSGSEVSNALVLHDPSRERHVTIRGRGCEPDVAMLDGEMLATLPERPMIYAALDALSHALEAMWADKGTSFTEALALFAADEIFATVEAAVERDADAMQRLIEASAMANLACGSSELGLVHALTSSPAVHLPHGYQNGVLLPHAVEFNRRVVDARARSRLDRVAELYERIGFAAAFEPGKLDARAAEHMVRAAMSNPFRTNDRRVASEADIRALLARAGAPLDASLRRTPDE